jgi:flagellin
VLAMQAASQNLGDTERGFLDTEFQALVAEIDRVANDTEFNGTKLINADVTLTFKIGTGTVATEDDLTFTISGVTATDLGVDGDDITDTTNAATALTNISTAIDTLNTARADIGAAQNRLDYAAANLEVAIENSEAARSTLLDLDLAAEITNFTSKQVLMQSAWRCSPRPISCRRTCCPCCSRPGAWEGAPPPPASPRRGQRMTGT